MGVAAATPAELAGRSVDCVFGGFVPRLTFLGDAGLRVQLSAGDMQVDEVVKVEIATVRPSVFAVNWTEKSGTFVVQVQDHENSIVHNYARLPDGQLFTAQGTIRHVSAG